MVDWWSRYWTTCAIPAVAIAGCVYLLSLGKWSGLLLLTFLIFTPMPRRRHR